MQATGHVLGNAKLLHDVQVAPKHFLTTETIQMNSVVASPGAHTGPRQLHNSRGPVPTYKYRCVTLSILWLGTTVGAGGRRLRRPGR